MAIEWFRAFASIASVPMSNGPLLALVRIALMYLSACAFMHVESWRAHGPPLTTGRADTGRRSIRAVDGGEITGAPDKGVARSATKRARSGSAEDMTDECVGAGSDCGVQGSRSVGQRGRRGKRG